ncbi:hypothetical protein F4813DRAFT_202412 [Daldinia decipiens]|uniref:uncharacterized protein n=1 Tax=Daldinia decipiens TaxID=326647 RepID=UPI0020C1BCC1|nr:uncharacterized protein F4813DRAFT_202412 [Daldinia decipiens]KAI1654738.1 hypothetical protein F4813DRAFT_202412 [Daldinia decipiens]
MLGQNPPILWCAYLLSHIINTTHSTVRTVKEPERQKGKRAKGQSQQKEKRKASSHAVISSTAANPRAARHLSIPQHKLFGYLVLPSPRGSTPCPCISISPRSQGPRVRQHLHMYIHTLLGYSKDSKSIIALGKGPIKPHKASYPSQTSGPSRPHRISSALSSASAFSPSPTDAIRLGL